MPEIASAISRAYAQGDDLELTFTVVDNADAVVDITGFTIRFEIARRPSSTTKAISTESSPATASYTIPTGTDGVFKVTIDKAQTANLNGDYYFEAEAQDSSADESTVSRGYMTFIETLI